MKKKFDQFPELVLVDATYKLNDMRMPVFLQLVIDGNGESEIVAVFVVVSEDGETLTALLEVFQKHNPAWQKTKTILTDKDLTERAVYGRLFPSAKLQLCLFHVLKTMRREIHCEKMNIRLEQKNVCLEIIQKLAYSFSEEEYSNNLEVLYQTGIQPVVDYFTKSWHPIKEQWVVGLKQSYHYSNHTTNRLESINQKLKQVIVKFSNLKRFFSDLELIIHCLRQERDSRISNLVMKRPLLAFPMDSPEAKFSRLLTPYSFQFVLKQISLSQKVNLSEADIADVPITLQSSSGLIHVSTTSCTCIFSTMNQLPCRHSFALRSKLSLDMYFEDEIAQRWRMDFYLNSEVLSHTSTLENENQPVPVCVVPKPVVLSQSQKYRVAYVEAQKLATLVSEVSMVKYKERINVLRKLVRLWEDDQHATVVNIEVSIHAHVHELILYNVV